MTSAILYALSCLVAAASGAFFSHSVSLCLKILYAILFLLAHIVISSCLCFIFSTLSGNFTALNIVISAFASASILLAAVFLFSSKCYISSGSFNISLRKNRWSVILTGALWVWFILKLISASHDYFNLAAGLPHGGWDAWAIWNNKARFMTRGGDEWAAFFNRDLYWMHPDYPLLTPTWIASLWLILKNESLLIPILVSYFFTFLIPVLTSLTLNIAGGTISGPLAGLFILYYTPLNQFGPTQYADIPLACMLISASCVMCLAIFLKNTSRLPEFLAGIFACGAAWTKNEGLPFFAVILLYLFLLKLFQLKKSGFKIAFQQMLPFLAGALIPLISIMILKFYYGQSNDLIKSAVAEKYSRISDYEQWVYIIRNLLTVLYSKISVFIWIPFAAALLGLIKSRKYILAVTCITLSTLSMMILSVLAYLVTPYDLGWHLSASADRLAMQWIYPLIFCLFLLINGLFEEKLPKS